MPTYTNWDYVPVKHDFEYTASIAWPGQAYEQRDWILGITDVEQWLLCYTGPKYQWPLSMTNTRPCSYSITAEGGSKFLKKAKLQAKFSSYEVASGKTRTSVTDPVCPINTR